MEGVVTHSATPFVLSIETVRIVAGKRETEAGGGGCEVGANPSYSFKVFSPGPVLIISGIRSRPPPHMRIIFLVDTV